MHDQLRAYAETHRASGDKEGFERLVEVAVLANYGALWDVEDLDLESDASGEAIGVAGAYHRLDALIDRLQEELDELPAGVTRITEKHRKAAS